MKQTFQHEGVTVTVDLISVNDSDGKPLEIAVDIDVNDDGGKEVGVWLDDQRIGAHEPESALNDV